MANAEIECIVRDTRELMSQISSGEKRVDEMIRRVNSVSEKMTCIREYQHGMDAVNAYTVNGSRRTELLEELQRENRQILAFHEENRNLREGIDDSLETLAVVMTRHRSVIGRLERISKQPLFKDVTKIFENAGDAAKDKEQFRKLVTDMSDVMKQCEDATSNDLQKLSQHLQENRVLREVLSSVAISTPGVKRAFSTALTELEAEGEPIGDYVFRDTKIDVEVDEGLSRTVFKRLAVAADVENSGSISCNKLSAF